MLVLLLVCWLSAYDVPVLCLLTSALQVCLLVAGSFLVAVYVFLG